jgi:tRNA U34 5-methylaminomethyl-2-thiouridine-forming methyltransferase MnmC
MTLSVPNSDEHYHSTHGALQESKHVYIQNGLLQIQKSAVRILEIGLGTGLNCLLTYDTFLKSEHIHLIEYTAVEAFPIEPDIITELGYHNLLKSNDSEKFLKQLHTSPANTTFEAATNFYCLLHHRKIEEITLPKNEYDLVYFDAFGPRTQPEMWSEEILKKMFDSIDSGGMLLTYCAKGSVKRSLKSIGFLVESLPGPPGKREMTRALKS